MKIRRMCVFSSSSNHLPDRYRRDTVALADRMVEEGIALVYGGGSVGLMGVLANRILEGGGKAVGVIPKFLCTKELAHEGLTRRIVTKSMHERKMEMSRLADAFAVLPGGFGTMDEFFEALTLIQTHKIYPLPLILFGCDYWRPLVDYMKTTMLKHKTIEAKDLEIINMTDDPEEVVGIINRYRDLKRKYVLEAKKKKKKETIRKV